MKLQTVVEISKTKNRINFANRGLVVGSCFADNVGGYLENNGFNVVVNPVGVIYNPISTANALESIASGKKNTEHDLIFHDEMWHSLMHHGSFSSENKTELLDRINAPVEADFDYVVVTLGTAWVYEYDGKVVANCHKLPANQFERRRLTVEQTKGAIERMISAFPNSKFIFTVSPIRHIKDGLVENSLSKSILRCAIGEIVEKYEMCDYFPAFEIVNDQLRDYRFYKEDMLHVSDQAVQYVIERFNESVLDEQTKIYVKEIQQILMALNHKPLHPNSESFKNFVSDLEIKIESIKKRYKHLDDTKIFTNFGQFYKKG